MDRGDNLLLDRLVDLGDTMSLGYNIGQRVWITWAQTWGEVVGVCGDGVYTVRIIRADANEERFDTTGIYLRNEEEMKHAK